MNARKRMTRGIIACMSLLRLYISKFFISSSKFLQLFQKAGTLLLLPEVLLLGLAWMDSGHNFLSQILEMLLLLIMITGSIKDTSLHGQVKF